MAKHKVLISLPEMELGNSDLYVIVAVDGAKLGQIHISKGNLEYYPKNRKKNPISISWARFDEMMLEEEGA